MNQFIYVLNNIVMCGYLTIDQLEMHIEVYHCSRWHSFFQPIPNLRRVVNPIVFFTDGKYENHQQKMTVSCGQSKIDHDFSTLFITFPYFFKNMFPGFSNISRVISIFWCHGYPGAPGPRPGRLKEVYDLSRTTSALSKRVGDPSWMVYFDPKIRSGGTPTTGMKPPAIDR